MMTIESFLKPPERLPKTVAISASAFENQFQLRFAHYLLLPKARLADLHGAARSIPFAGRVYVASESDRSILVSLAELTAVANTATPSVEARRRYLQALLYIYRRLPRTPTDDLLSPCLTVAPQREGAQLQRSLGWSYGDVLTPHAKRIHFHAGLAVGVEPLSLARHYESCVLIDGAIASGITVMALITILSKAISHFEVLSVHGTHEGVRAILRCADEVNVSVKVRVGHLSGILNSKYYAVSADEHATLQVGDLGDTIANLR